LIPYVISIEGAHRLPKFLRLTSGRNRYSSFAGNGSHERRERIAHEDCVEIGQSTCCPLPRRFLSFAALLYLAMTDVAVVVVVADLFLRQLSLRWASAISLVLLERCRPFSDKSQGSELMC
jgi:hypothetical protein